MKYIDFAIWQDFFDRHFLNVNNLLKSLQLMNVASMQKSKSVNYCNQLRLRVFLLCLRCVVGSVDWTNASDTKVFNPVLMIENSVLFGDKFGRLTLGNKIWGSDLNIWGITDFSLSLAVARHCRNIVVGSLAPFLAAPFSLHMACQLRWSLRI